MEKFIIKKNIGEFFTKMYEANKGKKVDVSLEPDKQRISIYYKETGTFDYVVVVDEQPDIDKLIESLSK